MDKGSYLCSACGTKSPTMYLFKKHLRLKHPDKINEVKHSTVSLKAYYECELCSQRFHSKKIVRTHLESEHCLIVPKSEPEDKPLEDHQHTDHEEEPQADHNYMDQALKNDTDNFAEEHDFVCRNCDSIFSTLFNLRKHVRSKHPDQLDILAPKKKIGVFECEECLKKFSHRKSLARHKLSKHKTSPFLKECSECGKTFMNLTNFHKHMKNKHPYSTASIVLQGIKLGEFTCKECGKVFSQRKNLRRHVTDKHDGASAYYTGKPVAIYQCPLCDFMRSGDVSQILNHFRDEHSIEIVSKELSFDTLEEFFQWKVEFEHSTKSSYLKKANVGPTSYFRCHRSGKYVPRGKGIRCMKTQGSSKIGGFCPAGMQVRNVNDKFIVKYTDTHVGHTNDVKHLKLSARDKLDIVNKLSSDVSLDEVLISSKKPSAPQGAMRLNLITKQDLSNIVKRYQLEKNIAKTASKNNSKPKLDDPSDNFDDWLENSRSFILYYKPQMCPDPDQPELKEDDFILIIMSESQRDTLIRFGGGCVCVDKTDSSLSMLKFTSLSVIDGAKSVSPVAYLFSNNSSNEIIEFFFQTIKLAVGDINPGVLLTDVAEEYYSSWVNVMGEPGQVLFCLWQVERDWRDNLFHLTTATETFINNILEHLLLLLHEYNQEVFNLKLQEMCSKILTGNNIDSFAQYFINNYSENFQYWSRAYRSQDVLNVDDILERLHLTLKYLYTDSKKNPRIDKTIDSIFQHFNNKSLEKVNKNRKITHGHTASMLLTVKNIIQIDNSYYIQYIKKKDSECRVDDVNSECECQERCLKCNSCIHRFTCTCPDYVLKSHMCSHIHLASRFLGTNNEDDSNVHIDASEYVGEIVIVDPEEITADSEIKQEILEPSEQIILKEKKLKIASLSNEIIESIKSVDQGDAFIQILNSVKTSPSIKTDADKALFEVDVTSGSLMPVKRVLCSVLPYDDSKNIDVNNSTNSIEAHITLDSDGITLLSQAANLASNSE